MLLKLLGQPPPAVGEDPQVLPPKPAWLNGLDIVGVPHGVPPPGMANGSIRGWSVKSGVVPNPILLLVLPVGAGLALRASAKLVGIGSSLSSSKALLPK